MIKFNNVSKNFGEKVICKNLSFEIPEKGIIFVNGKSGRGKTTVLRMISGLDKVYEGEITYDKPLKFSWVFQEDRLIPGCSSLENVRLALKDNSKFKAEEMLKKVGLEKDLYTDEAILSGGMKRRVAIARALVFDADVYIFDEPFSGIDSENKQKIIDLIKKLSNEKLCILVSHSDEEKNAFERTDIEF